MQIPNRPRKHHYIPVFYSKRWAGADGKLCEFSVHGKKICRLRRAPKGVGYARDLYSVASLPEEHRSTLETDFFAPVDHLASVALNALLAGDVVSLTSTQRSAWSRFIMSLNFRSPHGIERLRQQLDIVRRGQLQGLKNKYDTHQISEAYPDNYEEAEKILLEDRDMLLAKLVQTASDSKEVGLHVNNMRWSIVTFTGLSHAFLTSDAPMLMTDGIKYSGSYILVPVSPVALFVATNNEATEKHLRAIPPKLLAREVNSRVCTQAQRYVYGTDDRQLRFVANRLARRPGQTRSIHNNG
jgi:hypothetical protein